MQPIQNPEINDGTSLFNIPSTEDLAALERANALLERQLELLNHCAGLRQRFTTFHQHAENVEEISVGVREIVTDSEKNNGDIEMDRADSAYADNDIRLTATTFTNDTIVKVALPPSPPTTATARALMYSLLKALHSYGAPSHRLETIMQAVGEGLFTPCTLYYLPTFLILHFHTTSTAAAEHQLLKSRGGMNFSKLDPLYELCKKIIRREICHGSAVASLEEIVGASDPFHELLIVAMYPLSAFTSAIMFFHGGWKDAGMSALLACIPAGLRLVANRWSFLWWTYELLSCVLVSLVASLLSQHFCYSSVLLSAIVSLLPGYTITSAMLESVTRNIVSGSVRLAYVAAYLCFMSLGATLSPLLVTAFRGQGFLRQPPVADGVCGLEQTIQVHYTWLILMVPLYVVSYNYYLQIPYRMWPSTLYTAIAGYAAGFLTKRIFHCPPELNALAAALAIGLLANVHSKFTNRISSHAIVAGVFVQVPGSWGMRGVLAFAYGEVERGIYWTYQMLVICVAIAAAFIFMNHLFYGMKLQRKGVPLMDV